MGTGPEVPNYYHIKYNGKDYYWNESEKQWYVDNHVAGYQLPYNPQQIASNVQLSSQYPDYKDTQPFIPGIQGEGLGTITPAKNGPVPKNDGPIDNGTSKIYKKNGTWYGIDTRPGAEKKELTWNNANNHGEWGYKDQDGKWWRSATQLQIPPGGRVASYTKDVNYRGQINPNDKGYIPPPSKPSAEPPSSPPPPSKKIETNSIAKGFSKINTGLITPGNKPKITKAQIKSIPKSYDILFNSLEYQSIDEALIQKKELDLIASGDDILTDFNYESIDYLPTYEIQTKDQDGDDLPIEFSLSSLDNSNTIDKESSVSHTDNGLSQLANDLKAIFGQKFSIKKGQYFGKIISDEEGNPVNFITGVSVGNTIDFRYRLDDRYDNYNIQIRFDEI